MKKEIQKLKDELDSMLAVEPISSQDILKLSRKIDILLTKIENDSKK